MPKRHAKLNLTDLIAQFGNHPGAYLEIFNERLCTIGPLESLIHAGDVLIITREWAARWKKKEEWRKWKGDLTVSVPVGETDDFSIVSYLEDDGSIALITEIEGKSTMFAFYPAEHEKNPSLKEVRSIWQ